LKQNANYACTVDAPFFASDSMIIGRFESAGFSNVQRDATDAQNRRYTGTWAGPDQDNVDLPSQVKTVLVWE
jgi:hypothetical protein